MYLATFL
jgi:hypothetical protein